MRLHLYNGLGAELPSLRLILGTVCIALTASLALALSQPAVLAVDGQRVTADVAPVTVGNVAYLPLRAVTEAAGAETTFNASTNDLTIRRGTNVFVMKIGERRATLNGLPLELKTAPFVVRGRAMVRGADIALALGSAVKYDVARGRIDVHTPGAVVAGVADDGQ